MIKSLGVALIVAPNHQKEKLRTNASALVESF